MPLGFLALDSWQSCFAAQLQAVADHISVAMIADMYYVWKQHMHPILSIMYSMGGGETV